ncbi:MAG TPA: TonB-dependent receptor [Chryseosolibacter sp.]|nr:TonB-dependent receptor [Chryseosolibacter sp.]
MKINPKPNSKSLLFLMKVTLLNVLIISLTFVFAHAVNTSGQGILDRKVSLKVENIKVKELLSELEGKAEVNFTYRPELLKNLRRISIDAVGAPLGDILSQLFSDNISYEVIGKQIVLKARNEEPKAEIITTVIQGVQVTGKVIDEAGLPLPGVNVIEKGTTNGVATDAEGKFSLTVGNNAVLVLSFIGYATQEVPVNNRNYIDVTLAPDVTSLQEVVVVGYGEQKKVTVTGSVVAVQGTELQKAPVMDLSNSLAGRLPGVTAIQSSGEPGYDASTIRIRGINTLGNSNALIVIDGIPDRDGGFGRLSPQDIESISVLKDASAAIYGARAANGVILITTKRGKTGTPKISYDFNQGWAQPTRIPDMSNASEYAAIMNEIQVYKVPAGDWEAAWAGIQANGSYTATNGQTINAIFSPSDVQKYRDGSNPWTHPNEDWFGTAFKTWSPQSRHNLQLSGGTDNVKYLASLGYAFQDAYYKNSATFYKQYNARINLDAKINEYLSTSLGFMAREESRNFPTVGAGAIFRMLMRGRPTEPEVWPNGLPGPDIENGENPIVITTNQTGYHRNPTDYLQTNGKLEITNPWISGLKLTLLGSVDKTINRTKRWETPWYLYTWDKVTYEADGVTPALARSRRSTFTDPRLTQMENTVTNTNLTAMLSYDKTIANDHTINVMAGVTKEQFEGDFFLAYRRNFISPAVDQLFAGGTEQMNTTGSGYLRTRLGNYGRVAYNFKETYLAEFIWRYDGSYIFPESSRFGFFPGVLVGYNISNESFFRDNVTFIDFLKLRASYGQMGNDQVFFRGALQEYAYLSLFGFGQYPIGGQVVTTLRETIVANPDFTWEKANNMNVGLDATALNGKVDLSFDYFINERNDILIQKTGSTPASSGIAPLLPPVNAGQVDNRGYEFKVGYNGDVSGIRFNIGVNGGYAKNKVVYMDEIPGAPDYQRQEGKPYGAYLAYIAEGAFLDQEEVAANVTKYAGVTNNLRPGDLKLKDVNDDGVIDGDDAVRLDKTITPNFIYGITGSVQYLNFDMSFLFQGASGGLLRFGTESGDIGNYLKYSYDNRWTVDNPSSSHPRLATRGDTYYTGGNFGMNTYNLFNTNYLRLKNIEVGYNLPSSIMEKASISGLRIYVNAQNLVTWDKFKIWDPESVSGSGQYYPQARVINTGVRLTF